MSLATRFTRTLRAGLLLLSAALFALPAAHAQFTITMDEARALITGSRQVTTYEGVTSTGLQAVADASGPNQTFDFTTATYEESTSGTAEFIPLPADVPGSDEPAFAGAASVLAIDYAGTAGEPDSTSWLYQAFRDDALYYYGLYYVSEEDVDGDGEAPDELVFTYDPPFAAQLFPLAYGDEWTGTTTQTFDFAGTSFSSDVTVTSEVDAYGTLVTPAGSAPALRIKRTEERTQFGSTTTTVSYEFVTEDGELTATLFDGGFGWLADYSVATGGGGTPAEEPDALPEAFELSQNYPNPFNPETTIRYALPQSGPVTLDVFDPLGRRVATLVDGTMPAGPHEVAFDADGLPGGLYLYRLSAGGFTETRSMVLLP